MALFKQYNLLTQQVEGGASYEEMSAHQLAKTAGVKKVEVSGDEENVDPQAAASREETIVMPKYPAMPEKQAYSTASQAQTEESKESDAPVVEDETEELVKLNGVQLKALINSYCSEVMKDELKRILSSAL